MVEPVPDSGHHPVDGRAGWTVNAAEATYRPTVGGWCALVRPVRVGGRSYQRLHIVVVDPAGTARYVTHASGWGEAIRVVEAQVQAHNDRD